jgi:precorrin-4 methylase
MVTEMSKPATPVTVINDAAEKGAAVHRFRITKTLGDEIKRIEREQSHEAALWAVGNGSGSSEFVNSSSVYNGNFAVKQNRRKKP